MTRRPGTTASPDIPLARAGVVGRPPRRWTPSPPPLATTASEARTPRTGNVSPSLRRRGTAGVGVGTGGAGGGIVAHPAADDDDVSLTLSVAMLSTIASLPSDVTEEAGDFRRGERDEEVEIRGPPIASDAPSAAAETEAAAEEAVFLASAQASATEWDIDHHADHHHRSSSAAAAALEARNQHSLRRRRRRRQRRSLEQTAEREYQLALAAFADGRWGNAEVRFGRVIEARKGAMKCLDAVEGGGGRRGDDTRTREAKRYLRDISLQRQRQQQQLEEEERSRLEASANANEYDPDGATNHDAAAATRHTNEATSNSSGEPMAEASHHRDLHSSRDRIAKLARRKTDDSDGSPGSGRDDMNTHCAASREHDAAPPPPASRRTGPRPRPPPSRSSSGGLVLDRRGKSAHPSTNAGLSSSFQSPPRVSKGDAGFPGEYEAKEENEYGATLPPPLSIISRKDESDPRAAARLLEGFRDRARRRRDSGDDEHGEIMFRPAADAAETARGGPEDGGAAEAAGEKVSSATSSGGASWSSSSEARFRAFRECVRRNAAQNHPPAADDERATEAGNGRPRRSVGEKAQQQPRIELGRIPPSTSSRHGVFKRTPDSTEDDIEDDDDDEAVRHKSSEPVMIRASSDPTEYTAGRDRRRSRLRQSSVLRRHASARGPRSSLAARPAAVEDLAAASGGANRPRRRQRQTSPPRKNSRSLWARARQSLDDGHVMGADALTLPARSAPAAAQLRPETERLSARSSEQRRSLTTCSAQTTPTSRVSAVSSSSALTPWYEANRTSQRIPVAEAEFKQRIAEEADGRQMMMGMGSSPSLTPWVKENHHHPVEEEEEETEDADEVGGSTDDHHRDNEKCAETDEETATMLRESDALVLDHLRPTQQQRHSLLDATTVSSVATPWGDVHRGDSQNMSDREYAMHEGDEEPTVYDDGVGEMGVETINLASDEEEDLVYEMAAEESAASLHVRRRHAADAPPGGHETGLTGASFWPPPLHPAGQPPEHVRRQRLQQEIRHRRRLWQAQQRRQQSKPEQQESPPAREASPRGRGASCANSSSSSAGGASTPSTNLTPWEDVAAAISTESSARDLNVERLESDREAFELSSRREIGAATRGDDRDRSRRQICAYQQSRSTLYCLGYGATAEEVVAGSRGGTDGSMTLLESRRSPAGPPSAVPEEEDGRVTSSPPRPSEYDSRASALPEQILVGSSPPRQTSGIDSGEEVSIFSAVSTVTGRSSAKGSAPAGGGSSSGGTSTRQSPPTTSGGASTSGATPDPLDEGMTLLFERRHAEAREKFREAVGTLSAALGPGHPLVAFALEKLGEVSDEMGSPAEAHDYLFLALRSLRQQSHHHSGDGGGGGDASPRHGSGSGSGGDESSDRCRTELTKARIYVRLGDVYAKSGQLAHAAKYYVKSLSMRVRLLGRDHVDVLVSAFKATRTHETMALLASSRGGGDDRDISLFHQREALSLSVYMPRGPARVRLFEGVGGGADGGTSGAQLERSDMEIAKVVVRLALRSVESRDDDAAADDSNDQFSHVGATARLLARAERDASTEAIVPILDATASFYQSQNEIELAVRCYEEKIHLLLNSLDSSNDTAIANTLTQIGCIFQKFGRHEKAIDYLATALKMKRDVCGDEEAQVRLLHRFIASSFLAMGNHDGALEHYRGYASTCSDQHKIDVLNMMGILYSNKAENTREALGCYENAAKIEFGDDTARDSPAFLIHNLRDTFLSPKKFPTSATAFDQALDLQDMKAVLLNWGLAQLRRRRSKHAQGCMVEITVLLNDRTKMWEVDTPGVLKNLGNLLFRRCRYKEAIAFYEKYRESPGCTCNIASESKFSILTNLATSYFKIGEEEKYYQLRKEALHELSHSHKSKDWEGVATPLLNEVGGPNFTTKASLWFHLHHPSTPSPTNAYVTAMGIDEAKRRRHIDGIVFCREGKFDAAIEVFRDILRSKEETLDRSQLGAVQLCVDISNVYLLKGDMEESQKMLEAAMELASGEKVPRNHPVIGHLRRLYSLHYPVGSATDSGRLTFLLRQ